MMRSSSTLGLARRRRRRRVLAGALLLLALGAFYVLSVGAAYRAGLSQSAAEIARLLGDLEDQRAAARRTGARLAALENRLALREAAAVAPSPPTPADLPAPLGPLAGLLGRKLAEGVDPARLREVILPLARERSCAPDEERRRLLLATPISRDQGIARFEGGRFEITGKGTSVRDARGRPEAWFDPEEPVELSILAPEGNGGLVEGVLPLEHGIILGDREYVLTAEASPRRGFVELSLRVCAYP